MVWPGLSLHRATPNPTHNKRPTGTTGGALRLGPSNSPHDVSSKRLHATYNDTGVCRVQVENVVRLDGPSDRYRYVPGFGSGADPM